jgi:adenosylcobinamide-phosphate synthase
LVEKVDLAVLAPAAPLLAAAVALDLLVGDPVYAGHPARLMGWTLTRFEALLRSVKLDGYAGGVVLFLMLATVWCGGSAALILALDHWNHWAAVVVQVFLIYSLVALRDLLQHGFAVEAAVREGDLPEARCRVSRLVGRETDRMDFAACRRAAIESLSENLVDGFITPIFWYAIGGLPGIVLFKVVSTMDSMVGYKTPLYLHFGWCGARLDDVMNWLPARLNWLLTAACASLLPGYSGPKALRVGWRQHALMPGPNSGWSEATTAGAIQRRIVGQIWKRGRLVTDLWLGEPSDPPAGDDVDVRRTAVLMTVTGLTATVIALLAITAIHW